MAFQMSHPGLMNCHKFYDMTRQEQMKDWYRKSALAFKLGKDRYFVNQHPSNLSWSHVHLGEYPLNLNFTMF